MKSIFSSLTIYSCKFGVVHRSCTFICMHVCVAALGVSHCAAIYTVTRVCTWKGRMGNLDCQYNGEFILLKWRCTNSQLKSNVPSDPNVQNSTPNTLKIQCFLIIILFYLHMYTKYKRKPLSKCNFSKSIAIFIIRNW